MQKRSIRAAPDQSGCELHNWLQPSMFPRLLFWVSSDSPQSRRPNQEIIYYSIWRILLYNYALWT
jgi:hypothetical protein